MATIRGISGNSRSAQIIEPTCTGPAPLVSSVATRTRLPGCVMASQSLHTAVCTLLYVSATWGWCGNGAGGCRGGRARAWAGKGGRQGGSEGGSKCEGGWGGGWGVGWWGRGSRLVAWEI